MSIGAFPILTSRSSVVESRLVRGMICETPSMFRELSLSDVTARS
jgi:hypothetical protein